MQRDCTSRRDHVSQSYPLFACFPTDLYQNIDWTQTSLEFPDNQILAVKQALQEKEGIQVDQIKLIHSGKQLADDKTLEFYNITAGATIHMVLQLRGGL
jgi:Ubiquitin family